MNTNLINTYNMFTGVISSGRYVFLTSAAEKLSFFILFIILARSLPLYQFGLITAVFTFSGIILAAADMGLGTHFQREAPRTQNLTPPLQNALLIKLAASAVCILTALVYFSSSLNEYLPAVIIIAASASVLSLNNFLLKVCWGKRKYADAFRSAAAARILMTAAAVILYAADYNVNLILAAVLISSAGQSFMLLHLLSKEGIHPGLNFSKPLIKKIIISSLPMGMSMSFVWLYDKIDILLIEKILGASETAAYALAYSLYKMPQLISAVLLVPLFTELSLPANSGTASIYKVLKHYGLLLLMISAVCIIIARLSSGSILTLIFGQAYSRAGIIFNIIIFALPALLLNNLTGVILNSLYRSRQVMYSTFGGLLVNVLFNISMLKAWGIKAAVYSTILSEYLVFILQLYCIVRFLPYKPKSALDNTLPKLRQLL